MDIVSQMRTQGTHNKARPRKRTVASLTERIYGRLRTEILTCELEPGREVSEAELADRFQVSKTPVREALAALRSERLVRTFPRRGYQIAPVTFGDMNELFDLRTFLEAGAAELACKRITDIEIDEIQRLADAAYDISEHPSLEKFVQVNRDFHVSIAKASGNERLCNLLAKQIDELERFFFLGARLRDVGGETRNDHQAIVVALRERDPQRARVIMVRHNDVTREGLLRALASSKSLSGMEI